MDRTRNGEKKCYKCGKEGHLSRQCSSDDRTCFRCGKSGHIKRDCPTVLSAGSRSHPAGRERTQSAGAGEQSFEHERTNLKGMQLSDCNGGRLVNLIPQSYHQASITTSRVHDQRDKPDTSCLQSTATASNDPFQTSEATMPPYRPATDRQSLAHSKSRWPPRRTQSVPSSGSVDKSRATCFNCGVPGHMKRQCPLLSGSIPQERLKKSSSQDVDCVRLPHYSPLLDSHCHLEYVFERYSHSGTFRQFIQEKDFPAAFEGCITTFCDPAAFSPSLSMWNDLLKESNVWGAFGMHPHNAKFYTSRIEEELLKCLEHPKCVAFGEIGLDYSKHTASSPDDQKSVLKHQLSLALLYSKPLLLHCREAETDLLPILMSLVPTDWKIHLHCYTGPADIAKQFLSAFPNLFIGVTGHVTYSSSENVKEVVHSLPLDRLLLETDAPYCPPANIAWGQRSRHSHPGMVLHVGREVARVKGESLQTVLHAARRNVNTVYGI